MRERLIRFLLVTLVVVLVLGFARTFANWRAKQPSIGEPLHLPELSIEKLQSEDVLGTITKREPITEPVENIEEQTQTLIESIKKLPEDQIEVIKRQIFKDFCQEYCQECSEGD